MNNFKNRGISSCLSFLLVLMILTSALGSGFTPTIASASEPAGEATISIVFGLGFGDVADVALNKTYAYSAGATVEDLFDLAVAAGDLEGFLLDAGGFPKSITRAGGITFENAANMSTFWSTYVDGTYYAGGDNLQTLLLEDGKAYQFAWESWPTAVAPDWTTLGAPDEGDGVVGGAPAAGSATLAIVYGIGDGFLGPIGQPLVVTNVVYDFTAGATLEDMLDHAVDEWDIDDYALNSYGYLDSVSFWFFMNATNAVDFKTYWSLYVDGDYYAGADTIGTLVLENGRSYQFAWESYPIAAAPDWSALGAPDTANDPDDGGLANPPAPFSQATFNKIFSNIAAQFVGTGEDWKALEMAAIGKEGAVNKNAIIANAVSAFNSPDTTNLQRSILALTALGIDPANVASAGTTYDLIDKLSKSAISHNTTNGQMFALLAYTSGPYTPPAGAIADVDKLIDNLLALQNADGGWSFLPGVSDADMTAMGIVALAPYHTSEPRVESAIKKALGTLRSLQLPSGGFASVDTPGMLNINSTAMAIIALSAVGIDAQTWGTEADASATPLDALLSQATASLDGFHFGGKPNDMATEQGFRAQVAYQGFKNTGQTFNIYTQAALGLAGLADAGDGKDADKSGGSGVDQANAAPLPPTGDDTQRILLAATALVVSLLLCAYRREERSMLMDRSNPFVGVDDIVMTDRWER